MNPIIQHAALALALATTAAPAAADVLVGPDSGSPPRVKAFDLDTRGTRASFLAYDAAFTGGVRVASADVSGDGVADLITGAGSGAGATGGHVKVFDGMSGAEIRSFLAFAGFVGGVDVAAGDVNGDGRAEVIVGASSSSPHVKVFDGATGAEIRSFFAFQGFNGGVHVGAGDVNGDGTEDVIVGAASVSPHVKVFDGASGAEIRSFFAYAPSFGGGVFVAGGDVNGDGFDDIVTGAGTGSNGHVKAFSGATGAELHSFFAYATGYIGGVRVAAGDIDGDGRSEILAMSGPGIPTRVDIYTVSEAGPVAGTSLLPYGSSFDKGGFPAFVPPNPPSGVLQFDARVVSRREAASGARFTVTRTGGSHGAVRVKFATSPGTASAGIDYQSRQGTLSWASGDTTPKSFSVLLLDDSIDELTETATVQLSDPLGATLGASSTVSLQILDDDPPPFVSISAPDAAPEGLLDLPFTVELDRASDRDVTVRLALGGTATRGTDYAFLETTVVIPAGQLATTRPLHPTAVDLRFDNVADAGETLVLSIATSRNARISAEGGSHTVTILEPPQ